jgi:hypothetical protein
MGRSTGNSAWSEGVLLVAEAHRQSVIVASSSHASEDQGFIEAISADEE